MAQQVAVEAEYRRRGLLEDVDAGAILVDIAAVEYHAVVRHRTAAEGGGRHARAEQAVDGQLHVALEGLDDGIVEQHLQLQHAKRIVVGVGQGDRRIGRQAVALACGEGRVLVVNQAEGAGIAVEGDAAVAVHRHAAGREAEMVGDEARQVEAGRDALQAGGQTGRIQVRLQHQHARPGGIADQFQEMPVRRFGILRRQHLGRFDEVLQPLRQPRVGDALDAGAGVGGQRKIGCARPRVRIGDAFPDTAAAILEQHHVAVGRGRYAHAHLRLHGPARDAHGIVEECAAVRQVGRVDGHQEQLVGLQGVLQDSVGEAETERQDLAAGAQGLAQGHRQEGVLVLRLAGHGGDSALRRGAVVRRFRHRFAGGQSAHAAAGGRARLPGGAGAAGNDGLARGGHDAAFKARQQGSADIERAAADGAAIRQQGKGVRGTLRHGQRGRGRSEHGIGGHGAQQGGRPGRRRQAVHGTARRLRMVLRHGRAALEHAGPATEVIGRQRRGHVTGIGQVQGRGLEREDGRIGGRGGHEQQAVILRRGAIIGGHAQLFRTEDAA
ncbi:hypothetical protein D3C85_331780 [compost metagenome]